MNDALILEHLPHAKKAAAVTYNGQPYEDRYQDACEGLVLAARDFDPARGVPFSSYAWRRMVGRLQDSARRLDQLTRSQRDGLTRVRADERRPTSLDIVVGDGCGAAITVGGAVVDPDWELPFLEIEDKDERERQLAQILSLLDVLTPLERHVVEGQLAGLTLAEIARRRGAKPDTAWQSNYGATHKLRDLVNA